jgi:hypothetical protein
MTPEPSHPHPPERPGWMAIALIAIFVLVAIVMYAVGARLVKH